MHERTFVAAMIGLDIMLILAGGAMGWSYGRRGDAVQAVLAVIFISLVGCFALYQLNVFVFDLVESGTSARTSARIAAAFALAVVIGGLAAI